MDRQTRPTEEFIIALEESYWNAMKGKDGKQTAVLSADPSLVTGSTGVLTISKSEMGNMTEHGDWTLESYEFENAAVSVPAANVAIIAYTVSQRVRIGGKSTQLRAADCSTWVLGEQGWQCHAHSETILDDLA